MWFEATLCAEAPFVGSAEISFGTAIPLAPEPLPDPPGVVGAGGVLLHAVASTTAKRNVRRCRAVAMYRAFRSGEREPSGLGWSRRRAKPKILDLQLLGEQPYRISVTWARPRGRWARNAEKGLEPLRIVRGHDVA